MTIGTSPKTNINIESNDDYRSMYNCDSFRDSYKIKTYVEYADSRININETVFLDFNDLFLNMNRHFLLARCDIKEFIPRWQFRPNYLSYDMYGTLSFSYLLLFINDVVSILDFDFDYVKVPRSSAIKELIISNQRLFPDRNVIKSIEFA